MAEYMEFPYRGIEFLREKPIGNELFINFKALLFVMKLMGLFPFFEHISHYEIASVSSGSPHLYYSYIIRGILHASTVFYICVLISPGSQWFYSNNENDIGNKWIELIAVIVASSVTIFFCGYNFAKYVKIINAILQIDNEIDEKFRMISQNNCGFSKKFITIIGVWQCYVILGHLFAKNNLAAYYAATSFTLQNGIILLFIVYLSTLLHIIAMRFALLNSMLEPYLTKFNLPRRIVVNAENFAENANFIIRMHTRLLRIYRLTNECVNLIVLIYMGYAFYTITENIYYLCVETTMQYSNLSLNTIAWSVNWLILQVSILRLLCRSCARVTQEANSITLLARVYDSRKEHRNIIEKFLIKRLKQMIKFSVYGFFNIDGSTLFKVFSAMTAYLVILFQFKQLEEIKKMQITD